MKIFHPITFRNKPYRYLSDHSKDLDSQTLFVRTPRNSEFCQEIAKNGGDILDFKELSHYFDIPSCVIGITGTNGKTSIANMIAFILERLGKKTGVIGTQGVFSSGVELKPKGLTTPGLLELYESLEMLKKEGCEVVAMEVSSHAIEQQRIYGIEFSARVLSNITSDHLDYHKNLEEYRRVKNSFFEAGGVKIINADEENAKHVDSALYYGLDSSKKLSLNGVSKLDRPLQAELVFENQEFYNLSSQLYGKHNLYNLMAAILCVDSLFHPDRSSLISIASEFRGVAGRMEVVSTNPLVIVDFAHTHDGMEKIFESCKPMEILALFGAGGDRDKSKRPLMGKVAQKYASKIFITSDNPRSEREEDIIRDILAGIDDFSKIEVEPNRAQSILKALTYQRDFAPNAVLLLLGKGDETYQILGDKKINFDDRKIAAELISKLYPK